MYEIYDSHAHIYPDIIASKAAITIGKFYDTTMSADGSVSKLLESGKRAGISRYVVHSVATTPHQVGSINRFIEKECALHPEFIGFMTLHQDMTEEEIALEVDNCINKGFFGIKMHPDFQKFAINSDEARKIYRVVDGRLPILFHTGDYRYNYSHPSFLAEIAKEFPNGKFIGAHFGGWSCWQDCKDIYKGIDNVWFDTSSSLGFLNNDELITKLLLEMGTERFFFGCDYPMWDHKEEVEHFLKLNLTERQREDIFSKNLRAFLDI